MDSSTTKALPSAMELRRELLKELPKEAFQPDPDQIWIIIAHTMITFLCVHLATMTDRLWVCVALGIVMGHSVFCLANMCHYLSHNTIIRNPKLSYVLEFFFWGVGLHSATVWVKTHNGTHHRHTNGNGDTFRRFAKSEKRWDRTIMHALFFPNRYLKCNPLAFLSYIIIYKTFEFTAILGLGKNASPMGPLVCTYSARERLRVLLEVTWVYGLQYLWYRTLGFEKYMATVVVAYMVGNLIVSLYVHSQHGMMPLSMSGDNNPLLNSANLRTPALVTWLHSNVAYHIEHHLLPSLNYKFAPLVSEKLMARYGDYYRVESVFAAWKELFSSDLYKTPIDQRPEPALVASADVNGQAPAAEQTP